MYDHQQRPGRTEAAEKRGRGAMVRSGAQVVIGLGALVLVIVKSDAHGLAQALKATRISLLPWAVIAAVATVWLMACRWGVILRSRGHRVSTSRLFGYYLISNFFSNFIPGGAVTADVTRLFCASRDVGDRPFVLSTLIYERLIGMFTLLTFGLGATLASHVFRVDGRVFYLGEAFLGVAFVGSAMLMSRRVSSRLARLSRWLGARLRMQGLGDAGSRTLEAIAQMRWYKSMAVSTLLISVLVRVVWSLGSFVVAQAMDLPISLPVMFAFVSIIDLIRMLPISIGGIGVREWTTIALFANLGISREQALMFSFLAFAPLVLTAIAGGLLYISWAGVRAGPSASTDGEGAAEGPARAQEVKPSSAAARR